MPHTCHARGCKTAVPPKMLMCRRHWFMVPPHLQKAVWAAYVPGQEVRKDPTRAWHDAADAAIDAVFKKEEKKRQKERKQKQQGTLFGKKPDA